MTRVLIIEDESNYRETVAFMLRREGFDVTEAADGAAGLASYARTGADLVLLDLMMPGLPGTEVCRQLRATSNVPIIMVTARDSEIDTVVGLELGADDYITKPFSHRELVARMRAVLRRGADLDLTPDVLEAATEPSGLRITTTARRLSTTACRRDCAKPTSWAVRACGRAVHHTATAPSAKPTTTPSSAQAIGVMAGSLEATRRRIGRPAGV